MTISRSTIEQTASNLAQKVPLERPALPPRSGSQRFAHSVIKLLFPQFECDLQDCAATSASDLASLLAALAAELERLLLPLKLRMTSSPQDVVEKIIVQLPDIRTLMLSDAQAIYEGDPAAKSIDEVILAYPGFAASAIYRVAHALHLHGVPLLPRMLTEHAHQLTGIDIHPGATIGPSFCIDHGTGVVVGETAVLGPHVKLYQGVTLGALSVDKSLSTRKRHPTLEEGVVVYSNATILGGDTVVGHHSIVGGNVWLTKSIPPNSTVYHQSDMVIQDSLKRKRRS